MTRTSFIRYIQYKPLGVVLSTLPAKKLRLAFRLSSAPPFRPRDGAYGNEKARDVPVLFRYRLATAYFLSVLSTLSVVVSARALIRPVTLAISVGTTILVDLPSATTFKASYPSRVR